MDQPQVDGTQIEVAGRRLERFPRTLGVFDLRRELGRDVNLLAWHSRVADGPADALLVAVGQGRVDVAIADPQGHGHRVVSLRSFRELPGGEPDLRDSVTVGKGKRLSEDGHASKLLLS